MKNTKFWRSVKALWGIKYDLMPKWMIPVFIVCLAIPGPFDEGLTVIVVGARVLFTPRLRRQVVEVVRAA